MLQLSLLSLTVVFFKFIAFLAKHINRKSNHHKILQRSSRVWFLMVRTKGLLVPKRLGQEALQLMNELEAIDRSLKIQSVDAYVLLPLLEACPLTRLNT
jgi:hypothetical protein